MRHRGIQKTFKFMRAFCDWFLQRMLRISWTERKSNEKVLKEVGGQQTMMKRINQWQLAFVGDVMRRHGLENLLVTGI